MVLTGTDSTDQYSQRYISEIIGVRLEELFELVLDELARMGIQDLPGGIVISGGVAQLEGIAQLARQVMLTRVRIYTPDYIGVREPAFTTSVGLIRYANADDDFYGRSEPTTAPSYAPYPTQPTPSKKQANVPERVESGNKVSVIDRAKNLLNKFFD